MKLRLVILLILFKFSLCRDFYVGMFKKNDLLVAQDTLYKEKNYFGFTTAKYGRVFNCPITYFRVSDRLGAGRPPAVTVTRGGLQKKYITLLLTSSYTTPIAVNIYIGCENKLTTRTTTTATTFIMEDTKEDATTVANENEENKENEENQYEDATVADHETEDDHSDTTPTDDATNVSTDPTITST